MAKVLFIQLNEYELHGIEALAGELKSRGQKVELLVAFFEKRLLQKIKEFSPDLIGFSLVSAERNEAVQWARAIKSHFPIPIIFGGIDPTFFPQIINDPSVDFVCRGEGERAILQLLEALEQGKDYLEIENLWVKKNGEVYQNPVGGLIENLDELAFPDKEIYYSRYSYYRNYPIKFFIASRGCPFACNYCANQGLKQLYPNSSHYLRFKSPDYLLEEIKSVLKKYPARTIGFNDDLFSYNLSWMEQFLPRYRKEIGIPFFCAGRIDLLNEDKVRLLKEGGCYSFWYGLESANPEHREKILNRKMSEEKIKEGVELLHRFGISTQSYNILNYPGETIEDGLKTLDLNRKLKNDFVVSSLFQPFPGTKLAKTLGLNQATSSKAPDKSEDFSYFAFSPFQQKDTQKLENLHKFFILGFRSKWVRRLLPALVRLPKNPLFDILFLISFAIDYARVHRLSWKETIKYNIIHIRTTYLRRRAKAPRR